jgi:hypothetical protein
MNLSGSYVTRRSGGSRSRFLRGYIVAVIRVETARERLRLFASGMISEAASLIVGHHMVAGRDKVGTCLRNGNDWDEPLCSEATDYCSAAATR